MDVKTACIIGAGVSGVVAGKHLLAAGIDVTIYERSDGFGGVWTYDERRPPEPPYPSTHPLTAESSSWSSELGEDPSLYEIASEHRTGHVLATGHEEEENNLHFAPPGPCYATLTNNVATSLVQLQNQPWPIGTKDYVSHSVLRAYILEAARLSELDRYTRFNTRVERVWKDKGSGKWTVRVQTRTKAGDGRVIVERKIETFDAVVVASGHYHTPRVPDIPGLKEWKAAWPERVQHSKGYRRPEEFRDQNVLLIGAGTSSFDVARDLVGKAQRIVQSSRGGVFDHPLELLVPEAERVGEVASFSIPQTDAPPPHSTASYSNAELSPSSPIPGTVRLVSGAVMSGFHRVLMCTGYHVSLPFLAWAHVEPELLSFPVPPLVKDRDDSGALILPALPTPPDTRPPTADESKTPIPAPASDRIVVTDGTAYHNLHRDIFYIPDPTLAFIGVPYYTATFSLFEYQAMALAAVWNGKTSLPARDEMRRIYETRVAERGVGRGLNSLKGEQVEYVERLVEWISEALKESHAEDKGEQSGKKATEMVEGHSKEWVQNYEDRILKLRAKLEEGRAARGLDASEGWLAGWSAK